MKNTAKAITKYIRISPRKARLAAALIRGKNANDAQSQLEYSHLKGGRLLGKTLKSAIANAETQLDVKRDQLIVQEVRVDEGPTLKRAKPRSKGGRHPIMKRTSHFTVVLKGV
ncbi:MAG: 50S ribosomal protein L22 [Waddliaceae bacterium]